MNQIADPSSPARAGQFDGWLRRRLLEQLTTLSQGQLRISDPWGEVHLGMPAIDGLSVHLQVDDPAFYRAVAAQGSVGAGEAYIEGRWRCDDLVGLVRLLVRNRDLLDGMESGIARLGGIALRAWARLRRNTRAGSRRNIAAHYDLGNDFFGLFLSPDLMYSSAMFAYPGEPLEVASTRKLDRICQRLGLHPGLRVVEIGTGWGGFAVHAASHYGCHVTTTTISREQHALARQRIDAAGVGHLVDLRLDDYRDLDGQYDRLVSIEMIEAIGADYLDTYFARLAGLLKPDGLALLQAITIEDHRYAQARDSVDYIKRFVFPGSFIPSIAAMLEAKRRTGDLQLIAQEDFGLSYALTLRAWRERFMRHLPEVRAQGFDDRFIRLWQFYLAYCEGGFLERSIGVSHLLLARPGHRTALSG